MKKDLFDMTIEELKVVAFSNITDFVTFGGATVRLKPFAEIDPKKLIAIREISQGKGKIGIKLHDKVAALKLLGEHLGLFNEFNLAIACLRKYGVFLKRDSDGKWYVEEEVTDATLLNQSDSI